MIIKWLLDGWKYSYVAIFAKSLNLGYKLGLMAVKVSFLLTLF